MQLIIFGASGGTGRHLTEQALAAGHRVTAFVRNPEKLGIDHPLLTKVAGDALDEAAVREAVKGHDVVLSTLGSPANKIGTIRSQGTLNIVKAMQAAGIRRFVCQTSLGYGDSRPALRRTPFVFRYIIVPFILKKGFADHALQETHVRNSGLDWVIVRPGNLTDGPLTEQYRHGFTPTDSRIQVKVSRADVAHFMLQQIKSHAYLRQTPGISY